MIILLVSFLFLVVFSLTAMCMKDLVAAEFNFLSCYNKHLFPYTNSPNFSCFISHIMNEIENAICIYISFLFISCH